jgi:hypothetical protein
VAGVPGGGGLSVGVPGGGLGKPGQQQTDVTKPQKLRP